MTWVYRIGTLSHAPHRADAALPPIRATRTGRASQAKVPEISLAAVWAGRRSMTSRRNGRTTPKQRAGGATGRQKRRSTKPEGGHGFPGSRRKSPPRQAAVRRPVRTLNAQRTVGHERARTGDPQAARSRREDSLRHAGAARAAGRVAARIRPRSTNSAIADMGNAHLRGPAACDRLCL